MTAARSSRTFDRAVSAVPEIAGFVRGCFQPTGMAPEHLEAIQLAVEEVFTNMVKYSAGRERILIELFRTEHEASASLTDYDVDEYDIRSAPEMDVHAPLDSRRPGGLGIHLVKKLMDRIDYRYHDRCGTTIVTRKLE